MCKNADAATLVVRKYLNLKDANMKSQSKLKKAFTIQSHSSMILGIILLSLSSVLKADDSPEVFVQGGHTVVSLVKIENLQNYSKKSIRRDAISKKLADNFPAKF